jgi:hypothetical protein
VFGWDAIDTLCAALQGTPVERLGDGFDAHLRTASDPAGQHWWWIVDRLGADGELPSEAAPINPDKTEAEGE